MFGRLSDFNGSLFDDIRRLQPGADGMFGAWSAPAAIRAVSSGTFPPINIGVTPDKVYVFVFASGIDAGDLNLSIQRNLLTVAGQREIRTRDDARYYREERTGGRFSRVIVLPEDIDPERVDAEYRDGVLRIVVARREVAKARKIDIN